ncbi:LysR family transcriptional regulator [Roseovarius aestuarii]|uniref:LysR family transcriptional regulator n=1 Tax=Roseovarius aestuarii TaxID=475083 RepID=UPI00366BD483
MAAVKNYTLQFDTFVVFNAFMRISGSDIHLLSVFDSVVRNNGFSAAQAELGLSQPTISNHITALEERIGVKLCQRGRRGFLLTEKGQMVHEVAKQLMDTLSEQSDHLTALKGSLVGELKLATVDCIASDENLKLPDAIRIFSNTASAARLRLFVEPPQSILSGIAGGAFHLGFGSFDNRIQGLRYETLYTESHSLYCAKDHPLFGLPSSKLKQDMCYAYPWAHRGYWSRQRKKSIKMHDLDRVVLNIEAQILLVLSGSYLGLLPDHAAQQYVAAERLRRLPETEDDFACEMQLVSKSGPQPKIIDKFREILKAEYA